MDRNSAPMPIRKRRDKWEVVMMDGESIWGYIHCDLREDAEAVADSRPLNTIAMYSGRCEDGRARRCIEALKRHGLDERVLLVRRVLSLC